MAGIRCWLWLSSQGVGRLARGEGMCPVCPRGRGWLPAREKASQGKAGWFTKCAPGMPTGLKDHKQGKDESPMVVAAKARWPRRREATGWGGRNHLVFLCCILAVPQKQPKGGGGVCFGLWCERAQPVIEGIVWQSSLVPGGRDLLARTAANQGVENWTRIGARLESWRPRLVIWQLDPISQRFHKLLMAPPAIKKCSNTRACGGHVACSPYSSVTEAFLWK